MSDRLAESRHYLAGWLDGRRSRPSVDLGAPLPDHLVLIKNACGSVLDRRWTALLEETRQDRLELVALPAEIARATIRRDLAESELATHKATGPATARLFGEERMPIELVQRRRRSTFDQTTARLTEIRDKTRNYRFMKIQRLAELEAHMALELELAQSEAREQHRHFSLSGAAYLRGALRTHHDPISLAHQSDRLEVPLPEWVTLHGLHEFLRAAGAESDAA